MAQRFVHVALGAMLLGACGAPQQAGTAISASQSRRPAADSRLEAESYGLISRWLLDRNYVVATVPRFKQARPGHKVAVRGIFWATYRTKQGFLFKEGYWTLSLRDESTAAGMGLGGTPRGRYSGNYGPSYMHYGGPAAGFFEDLGGIDEAYFDDYDYDYTDDCTDPGAPGVYEAYGRQRRYGPVDDGMDCYPGQGSPGYTPGYGGTPYRSPYNAYQGLSVVLLRVRDNSRANNLKRFNGEPTLAFVDGDRLKEFRLARDGSAIWKTAF